MAITSGIIDGVGYIGGAVVSVSVAKLELAFGWGGAFLKFAELTAVSSAFDAALHYHQITTMGEQVVD